MIFLGVVTPLFNKDHPPTQMEVQLFISATTGKILDSSFSTLNNDPQHSEMLHVSCLFTDFHSRKSNSGSLSLWP